MKSIAEILRNYAVFDDEGRHINGCDKMSNHSYGGAYELLFPDEDRGEVKLVMEVGVADGSCLLAWRDIFPNATIVGMDIHHSDKAHGDRIEFHIGDQRSKTDCERATAGRQFDMILEDATHKLDNTLLTLFWLWPFVKPGGIYVVEEWENVRGNEKNILALWSDSSGCDYFFGVSKNTECVDVQLIGTCGPHIHDEPLVVFRKPRV